MSPVDCGQNAAHCGDVSGTATRPSAANRHRLSKAVDRHDRFQERNVHPAEEAAADFFVGVPPGGILGGLLTSFARLVGDVTDFLP
jgi:hypothetical protein